MDLTIKQTIAIDYLEDNSTTELLYGGAAGGGKSVIGSYWLLKMANKYPGTRWLMGRSELRNLRKTTLNSFFEVAKEQGFKADVHYKFNQHENIIYFPNGSEIMLADLFAYPSDPNFDSLGSLEITGAFIDECNQITDKAKNIVKSRIRYKLDENGLIPKMLLTCNPAKNWVYYEFYQPDRQGELPKNKKFIQALVTDNRHISIHYIENLKSLDLASRERLLEGNWEYDDDPSALIPYNKILTAFDNNQLEGGELFITCDVARFGKDSTVIGLWDGMRVRLSRYRHLSITQTAQQIRKLQEQYNIPTSHVVVDEDGVGGGCCDILQCPGFVNNSKPRINPITRKEENYGNLKSQCYFMLADKINKNEVFIDCSDLTMKQYIIQELEQVKQWHMDKDGKRHIMPKDRVKDVLGRSPDFSDALMMRMYFELTPQRSWVIV